MKKVIRIPTRVHTRKLDRNVARERMKRAGLRQINKHKDDFGRQYPSYFAENWRTTTANRALER